MNTRIVLLIALMLAAPLALADPGPGATPGLGTACGASENPQPCRGIIPNTIVTTGTNKTYTGGWVVVGTLVVENGGTVNFVDASLEVRNTSLGFIVDAGATLNFVRTTAAESTDDAPYQVIANVGSRLTVNDTTFVGGNGMIVSTSAATITGSSLQQMERALFLDNVQLTLAGNAFVGNTVSINQTGGMNRIERNRFDGGEYCIRDFLTDPTIVYNVFRGCHVGIFHEQSESVISNNDMQDEFIPPGAGIHVLGGHSPIVENNLIARYGTGVLIENARAYVRNNTIVDSVGDGIRVVSNVPNMDIQGNLIRDSGGDGIYLEDITDLPVRNNVVEENAGVGIRVIDAPGIELTGNVVRENAGGGMVIMTHGARISGGSISDNVGDGLRLDHALDTRVQDLEVLRNTGEGVFIGASNGTFTRVNSSANGKNGFVFDPQGPLTLLGETDFVRVRALDNGANGLLNVQGNTTAAVDSWWQNNAGAGVRNDDLVAVIDARNNYWGAASGPRASLNPTGTGDEVVGNVVFAPFRTSPP